MLFTREFIEKTKVNLLFGSDFLSFNDFLAACAIKHIVHYFPFIVGVVFARLAASSDAVTVESLELVLGGFVGSNFGKDSGFT
jgi:hypothetical protein